MKTFKFDPKGLVFPIALMVMLGCHQDMREPLKIASNQLGGSIPAYPWDWDPAGGTGADFLPSPAGTQILAPWSNGAQILYDTYVRFDFRKADGWKLEYNNFSTDAIPSPGFFALYNQYRGLLRFYWYFPAGNIPTGSTSTEEFVDFEGSATTSFFNFNNSEFTDPAQNTPSVDKLTYYGVPANGNNWYMSQYEVAYDYQLKNLSYTNIGLYFTQPFYDVSSQTLTGPVTGTAKGSLSSKSGGLNTIAQLFSGAAQVIGAFYSPLSLTGTLKTIVQGLLPNGSGGGAAGLASIVSAATSSGDQQVNLSINLQASLSGQSTIQGYLTQHLGMGIPGVSDATSAPGYDPADNATLGVFNLPVRPIINVSATHFSGSPCSDWMTRGYTVLTPSLDASTLAYLNSSNSQSFNPDVLGIATIGPIHYDILGESLNPCGDTNFDVDGLVNWQDGEITSTSQFQTSTALYLRVYFDVTPNNGAHRVTIVKVFKATGVAA